MRLYNLLLLACTYCLALHLKHRSCLVGKRRCKRPFSRRECFPSALWEESGQSLCNWRVFSLTSISTRKIGWFLTIFIRFKLIINLPVRFPSVWTVQSYRAAAPSRSHSLPLLRWKNFSGRWKGDCRAWLTTWLAHPSCQVVRAAKRRSWLIMNQSKI